MIVVLIYTIWNVAILIPHFWRLDNLEMCNTATGNSIVRLSKFGVKFSFHTFTFTWKRLAYDRNSISCLICIQPAKESLQPCRCLPSDPTSNGCVFRLGFHHSLYPFSQQPAAQRFQHAVHQFLYMFTFLPHHPHMLDRAASQKKRHKSNRTCQSKANLSRCLQPCVEPPPLRQE